MAQSQQDSIDTPAEPRAWATEGRLAQPAHTGWHVLGRSAARWCMMTAGRPSMGRG